MATEFPAPKSDQKRYVIHLPSKPNEEEFKVELRPGRVEKVDGVNHYMLGGRIKTKQLEGFGYDYYEVKLGPVASTRMAPMDQEGAAPQDAFIAINKPKLVRYNSRLPLVVYVPNNAQLRYRVWTVLNESGAEKVADEE